MSHAGAALPTAFYARDVVTVAREMVGCVLTHGGASGVIVETEAYHESEPACHAHTGLSARTRALFGPPGRAYVYRSYGIHALINAVCDEDGIGAAVLIRALEPVEGTAAMRARRGVEHSRLLCSGPGRLTQALGIELDLDGSDLTRGPARVLERPPSWSEVETEVDVRIGISRATELPWRFLARDSRYVSRPVRRMGH